MDFCIGMVVRSRAGRDAGRWLVITALEGSYALLADGDLRPLAKPKRKKLMHLARTNTVLELTANTTDHSLQQALVGFGKPVSGSEGGQDLV